MKLDSDYAVRLAILGALGGDTTKSYDSVYEVDLAILAATQSGSGVDLETVDVLPNAAENKDKILRLSTDNQIYFAVDNSGTWEWQALVVSETQVINDNVTSSETTWSSNKINSELSSIIGDANSEIVASETVDVTFVNAVPTGEGAEGEYKVYVTEQADTLYMYENGAWVVQTIDANKLYFDTENDLLYTYKTATQKFVEVGLDNTIVFSGSITGAAAKTALNPIKTPGVYNVLQHQTSSGKTKMTNWVMTVTYLDSDEADELDGSVYQKLENNYTIYKRYYKPKTDTWTTMSKYYEGLVRDSLTSSPYYSWSVNKIKSELANKQDALTAGANIEIVNNTISAYGFAFDNTYGSLATVYKQDQEDGGALVTNTSYGLGSVAEGYNTTAYGDYGSHAEGDASTAYASSAHAEGSHTTASGDFGSHAEGLSTNATGAVSHAEGRETNATSFATHAEGYKTTASGFFAHAEGFSTTASGNYGAHAEGYWTEATYQGAHAEGCGSTNGIRTTASGHASHAEGYVTLAQNTAEHAEGFGNVSHTTGSADPRNSAGDTISSVGIASNMTQQGVDRRNAQEIMYNGDMYVFGIGNYDGIHIKNEQGAPTNTQTLQEVIANKANVYEVATPAEIQALFNPAQ